MLENSFLRRKIDTLTSINEEILCSPTPPKELVARHVEETAWIERFRIGIAPQNFIPPEILSQILVHSIDEEALSIPRLPLEPKYLDSHHGSRVAFVQNGGQSFCPNLVYGIAGTLQTTHPERNSCHLSSMISLIVTDLPFP